MNTNIDWNYPQPRSGFAGAIDKFFGPGTTKAEGWLQGIMSVSFSVGLSPCNSESSPVSQTTRCFWCICNRISDQYLWFYTNEWT
jgi:hypothetical protein